MRHLLKIMISLYFLSQASFAENTFNEQPIVLDIQNVAVKDAVYLLAKFMNHNVVVSREVKGTTSLHLNNVSAKQAYESLLISQELVEWQENHIWMIGPKTAWMKQKQEQTKLQLAVEESAPLITRMWQIHYAKAEDILKVLAEGNQTLISKNGHIRVDKRTNMLCIRDTAARIRELNRIILRLDVPVRQVLVETKLVSVDHDCERELGIHFAVQAPQGEKFPNIPLANRGYSVAAVGLPDGSLLNIKLAALEREGRAEFISSPSLFTSNQETASIEAGEEIPYQEASSSGATAVTFKKAVLSLKVTPQILPDSQVLLQLQVNQDKPSKREVLGVPAISTRQMNTHILIKSGQTIVLGGIYEASQEQDEERIPILSKIPLVGLLFRQQNVINKKRELLIFVTPKIIN